VSNSNSHSVSPIFFESMYQRDPDPWSFSNSAYELERYKAILTALSHRRYIRAFEPGCSIGILTQKLATLCDSVLAVDFSPTAAATAQSRCANLTNVTVQCAPFTLPVAHNCFDLLVFSEIGYYFEPDEWHRLADSFIRNAPSGGILLAAHWLGHSADHAISGDQVHEILRAHRLLRLQYEERSDKFRLDRLVRV
jgi:SAM-dependent methyltransferase